MAAGITGCLVVRNEAALIDECLTHLRPLVDELIVVDHGSVDDTASRARAHGARVLSAQSEHHEHARNEYLEVVNTPWVLVVDADERLTVAPSKLSAAVQKAAPDVLGFVLTRFDYTGRGRFAETPLVRLFRSHPALRYFKSRAHASVVPAIEALGGRVQRLEAVPLHHLDGLLEGRHERKRTNMVARLRAELTDGGLAVMHCFLALELFAGGAAEEAAHELELGVKKNPVCEPMARLFGAQQALQLGRLDDAEVNARWVLDFAPHYRGRAQAFVVLAEVCSQRQGDAAAVIRRAVAEAPWSAGLHLNLAALLNSFEGRAHLEQAKRLNPWLGDARIEVAAPPSIFTQQVMVLRCVPSFATLDGRLGSTQAVLLSTVPLPAISAMEHSPEPLPFTPTERSRGGTANTPLDIFAVRTGFVASLDSARDERSFHEPFKQQSRFSDSSLSGWVHVRVQANRLCLGTSGFGKLTHAETDELLGAFAERGGHLLELATGVPEETIGRALAARRHTFALGVKFTNAAAFDDSLRRLKVDGVAVAWLHGWRGGDGLEVLVEALTTLLKTGKAQAVGVADAPAWAVAQLHARLPLSGVIIEYGLAARDAERELLPMAKALHLPTLAWGTLSGDWFFETQRARIDGADDYYALHRKVTAQRLAPVTSSLARAQGVAHEALLIRWVLEQGVTALVGATSLDALERRLTCLDFTLTREASQALDEASRIDLGFPHTFVG